jgi:hypothetical protein
MTVLQREQKKMKKNVLIIIAVLLMLGGVVRIFANRTLFQMFAMEQLWQDHPFFIYIYKLFGVFVLWIGLIFYLCAKDLQKHRSIVRGSIIGLLLFFIVSLLTGILTGLEVPFFIVDSIFALFLAVLLYFFQKK